MDDLPDYGAALMKRAILLVAVLAAIAGATSPAANAADPDFNAAFTSKTGHTGCEVRATAHGHVYVWCATQVSAYGPDDANLKIPYFRLGKHGKAHKHIGGIANIEWTAAKVPYGKWVWVAKLRNLTQEKPQHVPRRAYHGTRHGLRCIIRVSGLTCKNADQHGFTVAIGHSRRF